MASVLFLDNGETPVQGPITGGTPVTIVDDGVTFTDTTCDDDFAGVVIDGAKWTSSVTGSGSIAQNEVVTFRTGTTANSSAVLTSVPSFPAVTEFRAQFSVTTDVVFSPPITLTRFFEAELFVDANNYFRVSRIFDPDVTGTGHAFRMTAVVGGATVDNVTVRSDTRAGTMRVVRVNNRVIVRVNAVVVYDAEPLATSATAQIIFRAINPDATNAFDFTTTLDDFVVAPIVLFGAEPGVATVVEATLIRAKTPEVRIPITVFVEAHNCGGLVQTFADAFEYILAFEFRVLSVPGTSLGIISDRTLRNLAGGRLGFEV